MQISSFFLRDTNLETGIQSVHKILKIFKTTAVTGVKCSEAQKK